MEERHEWWQKGVIYQIYPRSFQDSDGDGVGDLQGIVRRLDYVQWLGVDAIWLSPVYPSPMADFGYDVADYTDIDPLFGDMGDFDRLLTEVHSRGLRMVLDFVPNHSSDRHPWFLESRSSRDNPKRDWYIWRDPAPGGGPPNNWLSSFGGRAWTFDEATGQYYHHHFLPEQPDLNWRNPEVVEAMLGAMKFWLDRGVDGFRLDVIWLIVKDEQFRDNPENPRFGPNEPPHHRLLATYNTDRPEVHDIISRMRELLDRYDERMMVGEIYLPVERLVTYYGAHGSGVHLPFNFQLIGMVWNPRAIIDAVDKYEAALPPHGWPNWVLGNHDQPRLASRLGAAQARVAALLLLTLRGTPTLYYGDEIGMENVPISPDQVQDPFEKNVPGIGVGRDPQRTPMQWDKGQNASFSHGDTWLPMGDYQNGKNVAAQQDDPRSMLTLYRRLLQLRRQEPALSTGAYQGGEANEQILSFVRVHDDRQFRVIANLTSRAARFDPEIVSSGTVVISTHLDREGERVEGGVELRPDEAIIVEVSP